MEVVHESWTLPDHLLLVSVGALLDTDPLPQPCDLGVDAFGTAIHVLALLADLLGLGHIFLETSRYCQSFSVLTC